MYEYKGKITNVIDGDTVDIEIDLGFHVFVNQRLRLARINTPEINSSLFDERTKAIFVKKVLTDILLKKDVKILTKKHDKYGRYVAEIWLDELNISDFLLKEGHAKLYE